MKQEVLLKVAGNVTYQPMINNRPAVASSATVWIRKPSGDTIVSAGTAVTSINATTGLLTYTLSAGNNDELGENYRIDWTYTVSSVVYYQTALYDVVRSILTIAITDQDLLSEQSDILSRNEAFTGSVASSSNSTLVDNNLKSFDDNTFNGGIVEVVNPATGIKQVRTVTTSVQTSGTLNVSPNWTTNPDTTYRYIVRKGFLAKVQAAFSELLYEIRGRGKRPALILESSELRVPHIKKTLAMICRDFMKEPNDKWDELSKAYQAQYADFMGKLVLQYDKDDDGIISGSERNKDMGNLRMRM